MATEFTKASKDSMRLSIVETIVINKPSEEIFDYTNDVANFNSFSGYGPIPGIREAKYSNSAMPQLGARREVLKTDGTVHTEEIIVFKRPIQHTALITGLTAPFSWLVRYGEDDWQFFPEGGGTKVIRAFAFELRSILAYPIAVILLNIFMRKAVQIDLNNLKSRIERDNNSRTRLTSR